METLAMTLLVILGAGASHDIMPAVNMGGRPPLTGEIFPRFGETLKRYPGANEAWTRILHGLATEGQTVETQLQSLRDQSVGYDPLKRHLMAVQFFLQDVFETVSTDWSRDQFPGEVNNLRYLVGQLEQWRVRAKQPILYVTFNYDTLLESELGREVGAMFESMDRYLGDERSVIKVHGSYNWKRLVTGTMPLLISDGDYGAVITASPGLNLTDEYHVIASPVQVRLNNAILAPAVSIPVVQKSASEFSCPPEHLSRMRDWMHNVKNVLVVGWHGAEEHFLKELSVNLRSGAELTIVGQPQSGADLNGSMHAVDASEIGWVKTAGVFASAGKFRTGFSRFVRDSFDEYVAALPS
jgi:hypothetical protein